ncbi:MAG TPA: MMPL family transporter [Natrialbaceae archaeon]|nr:MMPL family transporter [Natrialbaceae archaeon]
MSTIERVAGIITDHSKVVILVMLLLTAAVGWGAQEVEQSSNLAQFESETDATATSDYIAANFTPGDGDTTSVQIIVRARGNGNVLSKESLIASLEFQRDLQSRTKISGTLVDENPTIGVANIVAQTAIVSERMGELERRGAELEARNQSLQEAYQQLQANRTQLEEASAQLETDFARLQANQSALANRTDRLNATAESLATELLTIKALQAEYDSLNASLAQGAVSQAEYDQRAAGIEDRITQAKANASTLSEIDATEAATFNATAAQVRSLQHQLHELNVSLANGEITQAEYETQASDIASNLDAAIRGGSQGLLQEEYAAVEARAAELKQRAQELQERQATLQQRGEALEQRGQELQERQEKLLADFEAFQADLEALQQSPPSPSIAEQIEIIRAMNQSALEAHVSALLRPDSSLPGGERALELMPTNYEPGSTSADARVLVVTQNVGASSAVRAPGAYSDEIDRSMTDSLTIVAPLALLFVLVTLLIAYRDLLDILLGILGIALVLVWAFGIMGWMDITFNQIMIAVPVLLIGLSIDYAIHIFMRHREERTTDVSGEKTPRGSMKIALAGVGVALVYVTATTVIGFLSNLVSPVPPIQDFGVVSAAGITAALLVFGLLIPALKVEFDSLLEGWGLDRKKRAFGTGGGRFSKAISLGSTAAKRIPVVVVLLALVLSAGAGYYGSQVDTTFEQEDFLADDPPEWMMELPEPFTPGEYTTKQNLDYVYSNFQTPDQQGEILIEAGRNGDVTSPDVLAKIDEVSTTAKDKRAVYKGPGGEPDVLSPLTVMHDVAATNATFDETFQTADTDDDGVPEENVTAVYDALYDVAPDRAVTVIQREDGEYVALRMQIAVKGSATPDRITNQMESLAGIVDGTANVRATATGDPIVNKVIQDQLLDTVMESLGVTLVAVFAFLMIAYRIRTGSATLAFVTLLPVVLAVGWILGTMYLLSIPFNVVTGTITSLTIGLGVAYTIHLSERYTFELDRHDSVAEAMDTSTVGTGGALLGSAATTAGGFGVLAFSILPVLQQFGIITAITIIYACFGAVFILPSLLVVWTRYLGPDVPLRADEGPLGDEDEEDEEGEEGKEGDEGDEEEESDEEGDELEDDGEAVEPDAEPIVSETGEEATREPSEESGEPSEESGEPSEESSEPSEEESTTPTTDTGAESSPGGDEADASAATTMAEFDSSPDDRDDVILASGATVAGRPESAEEPSIAVERSIAPVEAEPGESVTVVIVAPERTERVVLRETVPGVRGGVESFDPEPTLRTKDGRTIYVVWDPETETSVGMTYTTTVPEDAEPGEVLEFEGVLEHAGGEIPVEGDRAVTVVDDRLTEFLEDGTVTEEGLDDASKAVAAGDLPAGAFEMLYRRWLAANDEPGEAEAADESVAADEGDRRPSSDDRDRGE